MALSIGELVGYIGLDSKGFDDALDKAGEKLESGNGGKFKAAAIASGAAIGIALGAAVVGAMDVQAANAKLAGQLGLTQAESARIGKAAGKLYASNYGDSLEDVNDALASVIQNVDGMRDASNEALGDVSSKVIDVAKTFDQDYGGVTRAIANLMRTGLAPDAKAALDIITVGMQNGANKADDLLDTFNEYPTVIRTLGVDAATFTGLLSQGLKGGARDSDQVADALKEMSLQVGQNATGVADALADIGVNGATATAAIAAGGPAARLATAQILDGLRQAQAQGKDTKNDIATIFGGPGEDLGAALFSLNLDTAAGSLGDVNGAVDRLDKTVGTTASGNIESFRRQLQVTFTSVVGGLVIPTLTKVTGWFSSNLGPAIDGVTAFLKEHKETVRAVGVVLGVVAGAIAAVVVVTKAWAIAQGILNAVLTANPIGIVVVALAAVVAALVLAYNKIDWFRQMVDTAWSVLKVGFAAVGDVIAGVYHGVIEPIWNAFVAGAQWLYAELQPFFAWVSAKWAEVGARVQAAWTNTIQPALSAFGQAVGSVVSEYLQKFSDWWQANWPAISATLQAAWANYIQPTFVALGNILLWVWHNVFEPGFAWISANGPAIAATLRGAIDIIVTGFQWLGAIVGAVFAAVAAVWNAGAATFRAVQAGISGGLSILSGAFSAVGSIGSSAWTLIQAGWSTAVAFFTGIKTSVTNALSGAGTWLFDAGKAIINGFINGLKSAFDAVKATLSSLTSLIPSWKGPPVRDAVLLREAGQLVIGGFVGGLESRYGDVRRSLAGLSSELDGALLPMPTGMRARGGDGAQAGQVPATSAQASGRTVNIVNNVTGWEGRELTAYNDMQIGPE